jgi:DNA-binding response OmpR family regulator
MSSKENISDPHLILIVEDSPTQRENLRHILEKNDFLVAAAVNGREALSMLQELRPTAVISDIVMPEMDGYELCRSIKKNHELQKIPVLLLTSLSDPEDVIMGLECGADYFIMKPYNEEFLLSRIQHILANRSLESEQALRMGLEIFFRGKKYFINSDRLQILNLLLSTNETAIQKNQELVSSTEELADINYQLQENMAEMELLNMEMKSLNAELELQL